MARSRYSLNYQHHLTSKFTSLASNSANESILNWLLLSTVHSTTLALNTCHLYYILILHPLLLPSVSSPNLNIALASCDGFRHADPSLWNSHPHHPRYTDSYTVFKSDKKTHIFSGACISVPLTIICLRLMVDEVIKDYILQSNALIHKHLA